MAKKIYLGAEARKKLISGMKQVFDLVKVTYGANGRNVVYNKWTRVPVASNDGVNLAREVEPEDLAELQGANLIKQVAESTNAELEDGSTATIISSYSMADLGIKLIDSEKKVSPMKLRKEMRDAAKKVIEELNKSKIVIKSLEDLENLAITSIESEESGKIIAKAIFDAGDNGILYVNESDTIGISIEKTEGYQFSQGLISQYMLTNPDRMQTILDNPAVLITEMPLSLNNEFMVLLDTLKQNGTDKLLIICDEVHPDVIKFAVMNMLKGFFTISIVKKPMQKEYLEDISTIVGATAMTQNKGMVHPKFEYLGKAKQIVMNEKNTTIFIDDLLLENTSNYVDTLKKQMDTVEDENSKIKNQERIARLTGGVFIVNVGEKTEASLKYLRDKVDDAVNSLKKVWKAKDDGVVAGGGSALFHIGKRLLTNEGLTDGEYIVYSSCCVPLFQMLQNGGEDKTILEQIDSSEAGGYNAIKMQFEPDMFKAGIIDATRVISTSFLNASDFASDVVTYENLITPIPEPETPPQMPRY